MNVSSAFSQSQFEDGSLADGTAAGLLSLRSTGKQGSLTHIW
jgi:hypothetical protein